MHPDVSPAYGAAMAQVQRQRKTEEKIRAMDAHEVAALIHELEDRVAELEADVESQADALKDCGYIAPI